MSETLEALSAELESLGRQIEAAAVAEDGDTFLRLTMRKTAIPALLREARAESARREIARLEAELEGLEGERLRALDEPPPEVPVGVRDWITPLMAKNVRIGGITGQASRVGKELDAARGRLAQIEAEGIKSLV